MGTPENEKLTRLLTRKRSSSSFGPLEITPTGGKIRKGSRGDGANVRGGVTKRLAMTPCGVNETDHKTPATQHLPKKATRGRQVFAFCATDSMDVDAYVTATTKATAQAVALAPCVDPIGWGGSGWVITLRATRRHRLACCRPRAAIP